MNEDRPKVGVGVIIVNSRKQVLLLQRKNAHGDGTWAFIGGHLEYGETLEECARREVYEEVGIKLKNFGRTTFTNDIFIEEKKHYVTLYVVAKIAKGKPVIKEPEKISELKWFTWGKFPKKVFLPVRNLLKSGFTPWS